MRHTLSLLTLLLGSAVARAAEKPPIYLWLEPEWFEGVKGSFGYWTGEAKPTGSWGIAGPGISPEWTQGGESEWNSMGAPAAETAATCGRDLVIPRAGKYRVWVRYVDHRKKTEPFTVKIAQAGKPVVSGELGLKPVVPENDEYQLYWGFSFGWGSFEGELVEGKARIDVVIDKAGEAWRQVDAILITDDRKYTPVGREKPSFAYLAAFDLQPKDGSQWRGKQEGGLGGTGGGLPPPKGVPEAKFARPLVGGKDFAMWTAVDYDAKKWEKLDAGLSKYDVFFQFAPPQDIRAQFQKEFAGKKDVPIISSPLLVPGFYLGNTPDLSPGSPLRAWLEKSKAPFYIMTNYASGSYTEKTGPATYAALTGPLAEQFMGYVHGEAFGTGGISLPDKPLGKDRREHVDLLGKQFVKQQAEAWSKIYKAPVPEAHWARGVSCLSVDSISLAHLYHHTGAKVVGYELDATNVHAPMRIAFERGAARQFGGSWINYASGNFGDACNYFTQNPVVPRGAPSWFHSKYAVTDGVSAGWYRKMYYLNYLSGASAIFWEQGLGNQWMIPGPGKHPVQLSPFGRATEDFLAFAERLPDRGEPLCPVGILLSYGHAYERVNYSCKMLHVFPESDADRELREFFNVCWHPVGVVEGQPAAPDVQSMPSGRYGNIFDVLVDRPEKARALTNYPVIWAAGDVNLEGAMAKPLEDYVRAGGTLVVNIEAAKTLPPEVLGFKLTGKRVRAEEWTPTGGAVQPATPFEVAAIEPIGALPLAKSGEHALVAAHKLGKGSVITVLVPRGLGLDERAHPVLPYLMNGLTADLLPVRVELPGGTHPAGEIQYQVNQTRDGYVVLLMNNRGVDKTQNGVARVDRRQFVDVVLRTKGSLKSAKEWTAPRALTVTVDANESTVAVRIHPGDVQAVGLVAK
jgi:hypothetical protein